MLNRFIYPSINLSPYESLYVYVYITHIIIFMYVLSIIASLPFLLSRFFPFLYLRSVLFSVFSLTIYMTIINELSPISWTHKISLSGDGPDGPRHDKWELRSARREAQPAQPRHQPWHPGIGFWLVQVLRGAISTKKLHYCYWLWCVFVKCLKFR